MKHYYKMVNSYSEFTGNRHDYLNLLKLNEGLIIIKFSAPWCKPCAEIKDFVIKQFLDMPENTLCIEIDIDNSIDIYAYLKSKKMVVGIPTLFCYVKGNESFAPDEFVSGSDLKEIAGFFTSCKELL